MITKTKNVIQYKIKSTIKKIIFENKINPDYNAAVKINLIKDSVGKVSAKYSFVLYKTVIENNKLFIKNTYDLLAENNNDKALEKEILFYASLFAGVQQYTKVQKEYPII